MNKTKIEWCDYTVNPVKGICPMACPYCYARAMYKRFKWNPEIRLDLSVFDPLTFIKGKRIFVGSTMELFHDDIPDDWRWGILEYCKVRKQHTFIFLTKQPQNLIKWSPFPENCWVGVSASNEKELATRAKLLASVQASVKFASVEPLLSWDLVSPYHLSERFKEWFDWFIIGQQTPILAKTQPKIEWVQEIVEAADKVGIPVFLKNNLRPLIATLSATEALPFYDSQTCELRQESPK